MIVLNDLAARSAVRFQECECICSADNNSSVLVSCLKILISITTRPPSLPPDPPSFPHLLEKLQYNQPLPDP